MSKLIDDFTRHRNTLFRIGVTQSEIEEMWEWLENTFTQQERDFNQAEESRIVNAHLYHRALRERFEAEKDRDEAVKKNKVLERAMAKIDEWYPKSELEVMPPTGSFIRKARAEIEKETL